MIRGGRRRGCPFPWTGEKTEIRSFELGVVKIQTAAFLEAGGKQSMGKSLLPLPSVKASAAVCSVESSAILYQAESLGGPRPRIHSGLQYGVASRHFSISGYHTEKTLVASFEGT